MEYVLLAKAIISQLESHDQLSGDHLAYYLRGNETKLASVLENLLGKAELPDDAHYDPSTGSALDNAPFVAVYNDPKV